MRECSVAQAPGHRNSPSGIFPGWRVVAASVATQALQAGVLIYSFGTMAVAFEREFGATRTQVMLGATVLSLATSLLAPFLGALVDRRSVRSLMLVALGALALGLVALSQARALWQVWLVFGTLLPVGNLLLGQLPTAALVTRWFSRLRGRAMGIAATGTSLGGFVLPVLLTSLIERFGWRHALAMLGVGAFVLVAPLVHRLVVDHPADRGLHPDGDAVAAARPSNAAGSHGGLAEILRERAFWCETLAIGLGLFVYLGFLSNLYPHALATGQEPARAAALMSVVALCSVAGKLGFGTVADRMDLRRTMWLAFALMGVGTLVLSQAASYAALVAGAVLFGLAAGGLLPVWGAMVARSFGPERFGRALGAMNLAMAPLTLLSAPYAGYLFDRMGSYEWAFASYAAVLTIAVLALVPLRFPADRATLDG
jgi:MFS family permease